MSEPLLLGLALGLVGVVLVVLVLAGQGSAVPARRLARAKGAPLPAKVSVEEKLQGVLRTQKDSEIAAFDHLIKTLLPQPAKLRARLGRTGRNISLGTYLLINGVAVALGYLVLAQMFGMKPMLAALFGTALGLLLPHLVIGGMGKKRITLFLKHFPEAIDTMVRGLRSGLPISESIAAVGREIPGPVGEEFQRIADAVRLGQSMESAMWEVANRIDTPEYRFMIIAMSIQRETGGNLGETLANLAELLRKRRGLRLKIRALSSEARASAMIIGSLPFFMFGILLLLNREYAMVLINTPGGNNLLILAGVMMAIGHGTMDRMIRFEI